MLQMHLCFDPVLRETAAPVAVVDDAVRAILSDMVAMMDAAAGVGLAAPQVGISQRFLVMRDIAGNREKGAEANAPLLKMINPKITLRSSDNVVREEGCLSVLGPDSLPIYADVTRPATVTVEWMDENGNTHVREFTDVAACIIQHEIDHLDGILFIDYLPAAKREMVMSKVRKKKK